MNTVSKEVLHEALHHFQYAGTLIRILPFGSGHINDTYLAVFDIGGMGQVQVILQRMNRHVFRDPVRLMENITGITRFLREKITAAGGDPERETLNIISSIYGQPFYVDSQGEYWRSYKFISDAFCLDQAENPLQLYESARAFGRFQELLHDYPAKTLHETIPGFHDTRARFRVFKEAVNRDCMGRAKHAEREIDFFMEREATASVFMDQLDRGKLPLRVTHNDTKLNNVMLDNRTGKGLCVIDLDTVMPGLVMNDFGDSIRFGASTAAEDEKDLSKVSCSLELFEAYTKGFLEGCGSRLTESEINQLPMGAKMMTFECGIRFLTDYLEGDTYFKIHRPEHNLDRCRTQMKLVADMEQKWEEMHEIIHKF